MFNSNKSVTTLLTALIGRMPICPLAQFAGLLYFGQSKNSSVHVIALYFKHVWQHICLSELRQK